MSHLHLRDLRSAAWPSEDQMCGSRQLKDQQLRMEVLRCSAEAIEKIHVSSNLYDVIPFYSMLNPSAKTSFIYP